MSVRFARGTDPRRRRRGAVILGLATLELAILGAREASAQPRRDPVAAEALFNSGVAALDKGDWATACQKFRASYALDPSPGSSINVARCLEHEGQLALAWLEFQTARSLNRDTVSEVRRAEVEAFVTKAIAAIEPRLPRLRIVVENPPPGLTVLRDDAPVAVGALGEALPVDPGSHRVIVRAPGYLDETRDVQAAEGALVEVAIQLRAAPAAAPASPAPPILVPFRPGAEPPSDDARGLGGLQVGGLVIGGIGVAGVGVGAVTGVMALSLKTDVESLCDEQAKRCTGDGLRKAEEGSTVAAVSTVGFLAGGALVATGVVLYLFGGPEDRGPTRATIAPLLGPGAGGVIAHGSL